MGPSERSTTPATVEGPAGHLHVDDGGRGGLAVLFLHSFAGTAAQWAAQLAHLRPSRRAIAFDFRGHGASEDPTNRDYTVRALAADVDAVVCGLGLERFVLVGHSMGAAAAAAYAAEHPTQVAGLVLAGSPGKPSPERSAKIVASMEADFENVYEGYWKTLLAGARPQVEEQIRAEKKRISRDAALAMVREIGRFDPLSALQSFPGPKLLIDTPQAAEMPGSLHSLAPSIPHAVITGTSHWSQMDRPEEFDRILDEFLGGVS